MHGEKLFLFSMKKKSKNLLNKKFQVLGKIFAFRQESFRVVDEKIRV